MGQFIFMDITNSGHAGMPTSYLKVLFAYFSIVRVFPVLSYQAIGCEQLLQKFSDKTR